MLAVTALASVGLLIAQWFFFIGALRYAVSEGPCVLFGGGGMCSASSNTDLCLGHRCAITRCRSVLRVSLTSCSCSLVPKHADKLVDGKLYVMALNHGV